MPHMSPRLAPLSALLLALPLSACGAPHIGRPLATGANLVSHQLCSAVFVGGQDPDRYYREALAPDLSFLEPLAHHTVDRAKGEVTASLAGVRSRAVYRGVEGCLVVQGPVKP